MNLFNNNKSNSYFVLETPKSDQYDAIIFITGENRDVLIDNATTLNKYIPKTVLVFTLIDSELWGGLLGNEKGLVKITGNDKDAKLNIENSIKILNNVCGSLGVELVRKDGMNLGKKSE